MSQSYYAKSDASSAGASLAAAREEMNLSVADVARHLKLTPAQVEALEEGAYERLPGRVFVRGFLRNYAKLLGIDPQPLLRRIEHEMPQPKVVQEAPHQTEAVMPTGETSRWPLYSGVILIIIAALAAYEFGFNSPPSTETPASAATDSTSVTPPVPAAGPVAAAPAAAAPSVPSAPDASVKPQPAFVPGNVPPSSGSGVPLNPALNTQTTQTTQNTQAQASRDLRTGERELHFKFETESWVEIRDRNDKIIFSKLNRPGAEERVAGTPPLKLVVGNARGVRLNYGTENVDLAPHIGVTVARLTLQ